MRNQRWPGMCVAAVLGVLGVSPAVAQYQVQQDGRLFDANPALGAGGRNAARPTTPMIGGNAYLSGNVRGGFAFQGQYAIPDANTFRSPLGSGTLSGFRRDSFSAADRYNSMRMNTLPGGLGQPYYDPSTTAPTGGFLGQVRAPYTPAAVLGVMPGAGTVPGTISPLDTRVTPTVEGTLPSQAGPMTPVASSIFGIASGGMQPPTLPSGLAPRPTLGLLTPGAAPPGEVTAEDPDDMRVSGGVGERVGTPLDLLMGEQGVSSFLAERATEAEDLPSSTLGYLAPTPPTDEPAALPDMGRTPAAVASLPGFDLFSDMRMALELARNPQASWYAEMRSTAEQMPRGSEDFAPPPTDGAEFAEAVMSRPVTTFAGQGKSPINDLILQGEAALDDGRYFDAAARFDAATRLDPSNPLPLIGQAHALLAGGEYNAAATLLVRGLERFPELARFPLDLSALLGGGEIVDIRRADLKRRLEGAEDARLRFLLGYLEYHGGNRAAGLANLRQAAEAAERGSAIARYADLLGAPPAAPPQP
jgi:hypothetical protein